MASIKVTLNVVILTILSYSSQTSYGKCIAYSNERDGLCQLENENPMKLRSSNQTITIGHTPGLYPHPKPSDIDNEACLVTSNMEKGLLEVDFEKPHAQLNSIKFSPSVGFTTNGTHFPNAGHFENLMFQSNGSTELGVSGIQYQRIKRLTAQVANQTKSHKRQVVKRKSTHPRHHSHIHRKKHHHAVVAQGDQTMFVM